MDLVTRLLAFARCALALPATAGLVAAGPAGAAEPSEYAVKAAYLAKFPAYVEWPPEAFATPTSPVVVCVVGDDPFGPLLDEALAAHQVQGRPMTARRLKAVARDSGCHIVFLSGDARGEGLRSALVVTDSASGGGVINFVLRDKRVRFTVDDEAAAQNGLAISSKLLSVALSVKPRGSRG
ncbi:MAG TPA: YfiR family protein [Albitalea sp.]